MKKRYIFLNFGASIIFTIIIYRNLPKTLKNRWLTAIKIACFSITMFSYIPEVKAIDDFDSSDKIEKIVSNEKGNEMPVDSDSQISEFERKQKKYEHLRIRAIDNQAVTINHQRARDTADNLDFFNEEIVPSTFNPDYARSLRTYDRLVYVNNEEILPRESVYDYQREIGWFLQNKNTRRLDKELVMKKERVIGKVYFHPDSYSVVFVRDSYNNKPDYFWTIVNLSKKDHRKLLKQYKNK